MVKKFRTEVQRGFFVKGIICFTMVLAISSVAFADRNEKLKHSIEKRNQKREISKEIEKEKN